MDTLLGRECQDVEKFYPTVLSETNGEEMLKRPHFIGSLWEVNNLVIICKISICFFYCLDRCTSN